MHSSRRHWHSPTDSLVLQQASDHCCRYTDTQLLVWETTVDEQLIGMHAALKIRTPIYNLQYKCFTLWAACSAWLIAVDIVKTCQNSYIYANVCTRIVIICKYHTVHIHIGVYEQRTIQTHDLEYLCANVCFFLHISTCVQSPALAPLGVAGILWTSEGSLLLRPKLGECPGGQAHHARSSRLGQIGTVALPFLDTLIMMKQVVMNSG